MTTAQGGVITGLSASQAETFDLEQVGGCPRRWWLERVGGLERPQSDAAREDGHAGHAHFAHYYRTGERPRRARMGKAVNGALDAGHLPARDAGQLIESRFDGQPARDTAGERLPLRTSSTLWLGGVPWDGYVDLRFYRAGMITVLDHKFSSDIHAYAKPTDELLLTVQMPVYALDSLRIWPDAQHIELVHHYVSRRGVDSFKRRQLVTVAQARQRGVEIEALVARMQAVARATSQDAVPFNLKSCDTWSGCPFQSRCTAFRGRFKMSLEDDELSWLLVEAVEGGATAKDKRPVTAAELQVLADEAAKRADAGGNDGGDVFEAQEAHRAADAAEREEMAAMDEARRVVDVERAAAVVEVQRRAVTPNPALLSVGGDHAPQPPAGEDPFAVFAPAASVPAAGAFVPPACTACGQELNSENGSQKDGVWKHTGCPADAPRAPRAAAGGPKCPTCSHPPHDGAACSGKRGRGTCRCGAVVLAGAPESTASPASERTAYERLQDAPEVLAEHDTETPPLSEQEVTRLTGIKAPRVERFSGAEPSLLGNFSRSGDVSPTGYDPATDPHRIVIGLTPALDGVPMLLWCPACHARHVDTGEFMEKPHHTHACQSCGLAWRPAIIATVGVQFLPEFKS